MPDDQKQSNRTTNISRAVLTMVDVQWLSYEEAAEAADVSLGTVKSRLSRARAAVRDLLLQHRELLPDQFRQ